MTTTPPTAGPPTVSSSRVRRSAAVRALLRRSPPVVRRTLRRIYRMARPVVNQVRHTWSSSLQLRMVAITMVTSSLLVGGFGYLVARNYTNALLKGARVEVSDRMDLGAGYARAQLASWPSGEDPRTAEEIQRILQILADRPEQGESVVAMQYWHLNPGEDPSLPASGVAWPDKSVDLAAVITPELQREVAQAGNTASQVVELPSGTYLVYGSTVPTTWTGRQVELYYIEPLNTEVKLAREFSGTIALLGVALVLLVSLLVVLITRLVVRPVRSAARTAQRLSAGLLDQRMAVAGNDELAQLGAAFNQMAANLQRQIVRLEEMSRLQRRFTSDVSHELRTPLTTVRMAADLLHAERDSFDPAVARSAELLQKELDRFEELLSDLLEISRFDAGFAMLDTEPADLVTLVHRVAERLGSVARKAGAPLSVVAPDPPVIAEIDPRRVERVLRNLIANAIDHSEGQPVVITLGAEADAVAVTVRDYGVGLRPGEEKLVFNRFWRADASRARQTGGTGLGLSISVEDARLHGGWLQAWGALGQGAQFRLTLPTRAGARLRSSPLPLVPADGPELVPAQPAGDDLVEVPS